MSSAIPTQQIPATYQQGSANVEEQASRTEIMTGAVTGQVDGEHYDPSNKSLRIRSAYSVAPLKINSFVDEEPTSKDYALGDKISILFGKNKTYQCRFELHFILSQRGATRANTQYVPWLAHRLLGEEYTVKHGNERIRTVNVDGYHFRARLEDDWYSAKGVAREIAAGASSLNINQRQHVWCELDLAYSDMKPLVSVAQGHQHELQLRLPTEDEILRAIDPEVAFTQFVKGDANGVQLEQVFLRCYTTEVDQKHRFNAAQYVLKRGVKYHISEIEVNTKEVYSQADTTSAATAEKSLEAELSLKLPCSYLMFVLRYESDLAPAVDNDGTQSLNVANSHADRFNSLPLTRWQLREQKKLLWPETSWHEHSLSVMPRMFNSAVLQPIGVQSFTDYPLLAADHSLGHTTLSNFKDPNLVVYYVKHISSGLNDDPFASVTLQGRGGGLGSPTEVDMKTTAPLQDVPVRLTVWGIAYNFLYQKAGRIRTAYY